MTSRIVQQPHLVRGVICSALASCLLLASSAAEDAPEPAAIRTPLASNVRDRTAPLPVATTMSGSHLLLEHLAAVGQPVFSPDGHYLAVREEGDTLALFDVPALLKDPASKPTRYPLAPGVPIWVGGSPEVGRVAAFSADSTRMILTGPQGLEMLDLPAHQPPQPVVLDPMPSVATPAPGASALALDSGYRPGPDACLRTPAGRNTAQTAAAGTTETWPLYRLLAPAQPAKGMDQPGTHARVQLALLTTCPHGPARHTLIVVDPEVRAGSLAWSRGEQSLVATTQNGDAVIVDPESLGTPRLTCSRAICESMLGKPLDSLSIALVLPHDRIILDALRQYPPEMRNMMGTFVPRGDEAPERGSNPGDAEPGPEMPH